MTSAHRSNDGRIFKKECVSLAKAGYEVTLVSCGESCVRDGVRICGVKARSRRLPRMIFSARDVYKVARVVDADIYHFHDPELLPYGVKLAKSGKPVIFDSHENYPLQILSKSYLPRCLRKMISKLYKRYETRACRTFEAAIAPCTFNGVSIFDGRVARAVLVGNGCIGGDSHAGRFDASCDADAICCLGSLTYARGITHLVEAAYLAEVRLILCGSISSDYLRELQAMPEFANVEYRGVFPQEQLPLVMEECFAGVAIGLNMGQYGIADILPTKVSEYLINGLPVLLCDSPFNRSFLAECDCGIIVPVENIESFASSIRNLKSNSKMRENMVRNGREYALEHLTWKRDEAVLLELYADIVNDRIGADPQ